MAIKYHVCVYEIQCEENMARLVVNMKNEFSIQCVKNFKITILCSLILVRFNLFFPLMLPSVFVYS